MTYKEFEILFEDLLNKRDTFDENSKEYNKLLAKINNLCENRKSFVFQYYSYHPEKITPCKSLSTLDVPEFDETHCTSMSLLFQPCEAMKTISPEDLAKIDTSNVIKYTNEQIEGILSMERRNIRKGHPDYDIEMFLLFGEEYTENLDI